MNPLIKFKTMIVRITILGALTLVAVFGQVPRTIETNVFSQSSSQKMSVFATKLNNPPREIGNPFDRTPTETARPTQTLTGVCQSADDTHIFPGMFPRATPKPKTCLADRTVFADGSAACEVPFDFAQPGNGKSSVAPQGTCPTWQFVADMPIGGYGVACASDGTFVYCTDGAPGFNRYDPGTNTWSALAPIPNATAMAATVYYPPTNKIYVFGGGDGCDDVIYNFNQIYDIASNAWTMGAPLPDVRAFQAYGYNPANGKIYLVGGYNTALRGSGQPDTWEYDPVADTFTNKRDFPELAGGYASGIINGHLYVAGGRDANSDSLNAVWDYDIAADTWTQKNDMPGSYNNGRGGAVVLDSLFVFGGGDALYSPFSATNVYLPKTDEWRTDTNLNLARVLTTGAAVGTSIFAIGGYGGPFSSITGLSVEQLAANIPEPTPSPCQINQYSIAPGTDTIVPGDTDIGIHCDDCETLITLPFCFQLYDQTFSSVNVSSNGRLDFVLTHEFKETLGYAATCLPAPPRGVDGSYDFAIFGLWQDQQTDFGLSGCASFPGGTCGVFTSVSGSAPNRIFNIEWRTVLYCNNMAKQNYEIRLYENDPLKKFEVIIGTLQPRPTPTPRPRPTPHPRPTPFALTASQKKKSSMPTPTLPFQYVSGVQGYSASGFFTQDFCTFAPPQNVSRTYTSCGPAPSPTPGLTERLRPTP